MPSTILAGLLSMLLLLAGCGGGSSSGGGDDDGGTAPAAGSDDMSGGTGGTTGGDEGIAGTYVGPGTITVSGFGFSESASGTIQVVISENGMVSIGNVGAPPAATTSLNGDGQSFSVNVPASLFNEPGFECEGTLTATGTVNGDTITGTITGSDVSCEGIPLDVSGTFTLEKTGAGTQSRSGDGVLKRLQETLPDIVQ